MPKVIMPESCVTDRQADPRRTVNSTSHRPHIAELLSAALRLRRLSANRDEDEFENPDVFDIDPIAQWILSVGTRRHACIGMHVARLEARVCLEEFLTAFPEYDLQLDRGERLVTDVVHGLPLHVRVDPAHEAGRADGLSPRRCELDGYAQAHDRRIHSPGERTRSDRRELARSRPGAEWRLRR